MQNPPPIIYSTRVLAFATVDGSVVRVRDDLLFVGGKPVGLAANLAIGKYPEESEVQLFFCDADWDVLGAYSCPSVDAAKQRAEKEYRGLMPRWRSFHHEDEAAIDRQCLEPLCSFCGSSIWDAERMVKGKDAHICVACIRKLAKVLDGDG